jgi:hypothetical protein
MKFASSVFSFADQVEFLRPPSFRKIGSISTTVTVGCPGQVLIPLSSFKASSTSSSLPAELRVKVLAFADFVLFRTRFARVVPLFGALETDFDLLAFARILSKSYQIV